MAAVRSGRSTVKAPPVLFLHGQPGGSYDWAMVIDALGSRARTIAVDRPGWDGRGRAAGLRGNVGAALATLDATGVQRATVVGHSFGGAVAAWLATEHPERVHALMLVAPATNLASLNRLDRWLGAPLAGYAFSAAGLAIAGLTLAGPRTRRQLASYLAVDEAYLERAGRALRAQSSWRSF